MDLQRSTQGGDHRSRTSASLAETTSWTIPSIFESVHSAPRRHRVRCELVTFLHDDGATRSQRNEVVEYLTLKAGLDGEHGEGSRTKSRRLRTGLYRPVRSLKSQANREGHRYETSGGR